MSETSTRRSTSWTSSQKRWSKKYQSSTWSAKAYEAMPVPPRRTHLYTWAMMRRSGNVHRTRSRKEKRKTIKLQLLSEKWRLGLTRPRQKMWKASWRCSYNKQTIRGAVAHATYLKTKRQIMTKRNRILATQKKKKTKWSVLWRILDPTSLQVTKNLEVVLHMW